MSVARNGDVRIAYEFRGDGEPVLLVHGLGYDRRGWGPLPDLLTQEHRVLLLDNRGVGESDVPPGPYTVAEFAADAVAVVDAAGVERSHVLGVSLGGYIAQEIALSYPVASTVSSSARPRPAARTSIRCRPWRSRHLGAFRPWSARPGCG